MFDEQKAKDIEFIDIFGIQESLKNSFLSETDVSFTAASKYNMLIYYYTILNNINQPYLTFIR